MAGMLFNSLGSHDAVRQTVADGVVGVRLDHQRSPIEFYLRIVVLQNHTNLQLYVILYYI